MNVIHHSNRCQPVVDGHYNMCITGVLVLHPNEAQTVYIGYITDLEAKNWLPSDRDMDLIARHGRHATYQEAKLYFPTLEESKYQY